MRRSGRLLAHCVNLGLRLSPVVTSYHALLSAQFIAIMAIFGYGAGIELSGAITR